MPPPRPSPKSAVSFALPCSRPAPAAWPSSNRLRWCAARVPMSLEALAPSRLEAIEAELRRAVGSQRAHHAQYLARRGPAAPGDAHPISADTLRDYYAMLEYH